MTQQTLRLPTGYCVRPRGDIFLDVPTEFTYQPHVYELASFLARRGGARTILDIGCGNGNKLRSLEHDFHLVCVDCEPALNLARTRLHKAEFIAVDLEDGLPEIPSGLIDDAVVICADVVEHLHNPQKLMSALGKLATQSKYLLVSTPDRTRARGLLDEGPPFNPAHTMEWSADEFGRVLKDCGWPRGFLLGHTINTDRHWAKTTTLAIAGREALRPSPGREPSVAAIIHTFNERDVIPEVIDHLQGQHIAVHVFDNWSTDGTFEYVCRREGVHAERFPEAATQQYRWHDQLAHTARYAASLNAEWIMHHDADEIRYSPWPGITLVEAIGRADELGYNAVDFTVVDFRFLAGEPDPIAPYQSTLNFFEFGRRVGHFQQVKCWKNTGYPVHLADSGGHDAAFAGRRIFPLKFLVKHYPLRSCSHAKRKVLEDRLPRIESEHAQRGWHTQYDVYRNAEQIEGWNRHHLLAWHERWFESEYLVERVSGIGVRDA